MTRSIQTANDLIYTGRIDNDNIDDTVTRTCESIVEIDYVPAWFPLAGAPYYERDIQLQDGGALDELGSWVYDACQLYIDDFHLELTCLEKGLKNIVLEVPF